MSVVHEANIQFPSSELTKSRFTHRTSNGETHEGQLRVVEKSFNELLVTPSLCHRIVLTISCFCNFDPKNFPFPKHILL